MPRTLTTSPEGRGPRAEPLGTRGSGLAILSAVLYILSFPNFNVSLLAWIALVPLAYTCAQQMPRRAFGLGWLSGTLAYIGLLYWIVVTFRAAGQSMFLASVCLVSLAGYLGLYWGAWCWYIASISGRTYLPSKVPPFWVPWAIAAAWVGLEYVRTHLFSGFPWVLLADSQWRRLYLIQITSMTGVYGVSFLVALMNAANAHAMRRHDRSPLWAAVLLLACVFFGANHLRAYAHEAAPTFYKVALLQGSIDQYQKWDKQYTDSIQRTYEELNSLAALEKPALIIWPETSVPGYLLQEPALHRWLTGLVQRTGSYHIVGAPSMENGKASYNAAFSLNPKGEIVGEYAKQHLVPFGEIVPWASVLGRWVHVLNELGGFTAGRRSPVLATAMGPVGVTICYEAIFPDLVRRAALKGAGLLINLTNDGWYMRTSAPYQHFVPNVFRAVENDRWVLRADNTGVTAIIDPTGRVQASSQIFVPAAITGTAAIRRTLTFYTRYGDVFAWACIGFCILIWLRAILRR